jgi:phosphatidylserine decarboxylase
VIFEWLLINVLLGLSIASIGAHSRISNLNLKDSLSIGFISGIAADAILLCLHVLKVPDILSIACGIFGLLLTGLILVLWRFFRDPERNIPNDSNAILSPADGKVIYIREIKEGTIPCPIKGKAHIKIGEITKTNFLKDKIGEITKTNFLKDKAGYIIGIYMSMLDVHLNRAPISGKVTFIKHIPGKTISPKHWRSDIENERNTIIIETNNISVAVIQIGTPHVSKVLCYASEGENVNRGERIGKITWGSQVDVILPQNDAEILVKEGDQVYAGETIIAKVLGVKR